VITSGSNVTNSSGVATFTVTDTTAETVTYTATDTTDSVTLTQTAQVQFVPGPIDPAYSTLTAIPSRVPADGATLSTLTLTLRDAQGRLLNGKIPATLVITSSSGNVKFPTWSNPSIPSDGTLTFTAKDAVPETTNVTVGSPNQYYPIASCNLIFYTPVDAAQSTVTASPASVTADGTSVSTITVTLKDANGNPLSGQSVTLASGSGHSMITVVQGTTNVNGQATFTVTDTTAETVTYTATDPADNVTVTQTAAVTFTPDMVDAVQSTVTTSPTSVTADGTSASTITVTLKDAYDNPLSGQSVNLASGSGHSMITVVQGTTNVNGQATFTVTDAQPETVTYTATDPADNVTVTQTATVTFVQPLGVTPTPAIDIPIVAGATSVSGTAQVSAAIELTVNGAVYDATTSASGTWTVGSLPALAAGDTISVTATATGESGSQPATTTVQATLIQTPAPFITSPIYSGATSISGTAQVGAAIELTVNGAVYDATVDVNGNWSISALTALNTGDAISVTAQLPGESESPATTATVVSDGVGSQSDPYLIGNAAQLAAIQNTLEQNVYYRLTADIDLGGMNWTPLGDKSSSYDLNGFAGHLDGAGYVISNLTVNDTAGLLPLVGLFGNTASGSTIENLGLRNVRLYSNWDYPHNMGSVGALAGMNLGSITNCWATGSVSGEIAGGLVGSNSDEFTNSVSATITGSWAGVKVVGSNQAGGLVGFNSNSSIITDSYATGSVSGGSNSCAGGLVGYNYTSTITDSYATGSVSGEIVGGLVGGNSDGGTISGSYWDTTTTEQASSSGSSSGGESDNQMTQQATFSGWNTTVWGFHEDLGYPYLLGVTPLPTVTVTASPSMVGDVYGGGAYDVGDQAKVYAAANNGYTFVNWSNGSGNTVSGNVYYTFTMGSSDVVLVANFANGTVASTPAPAIATPVRAGDTSVSGTAQAGASVVLSVNGTAQPVVNAGADGTWTVSGLNALAE
jgi:copper(I)-binding protein